MAERVTNKYPKVGDSIASEMVNVSGSRSPNMQYQPRDKGGSRGQDIPGTGTKRNRSQTLIKNANGPQAPVFNQIDYPNDPAAASQTGKSLKPIGEADNDLYSSQQHYAYDLATNTGRGIAAGVGGVKGTDPLFRNSRMGAEFQHGSGFGVDPTGRPAEPGGSHFKGLQEGDVPASIVADPEDRYSRYARNGGHRSKFMGGDPSVETNGPAGIIAAKAVYPPGQQAGRPVRVQQRTGGRDPMYGKRFEQKAEDAGGFWTDGTNCVV